MRIADDSLPGHKCPLKKHCKEKGSSDIVALWKKTTAIVTSTVAYAETMASIFRKWRETRGVDESLFESVIISFQKDWMSFIHVGVSNDLNEKIGRLVTEYPVRGFDAIHLASALTVNKHIQHEFIFACYDKRLSKAATEEGLDIFPRVFDDNKK